MAAFREEQMGSQTPGLRELNLWIVLVFVGLVLGVLGGAAWCIGCLATAAIGLTFTGIRIYNDLHRSAKFVRPVRSSAAKRQPRAPLPVRDVPRRDETPVAVERLMDRFCEKQSLPVDRRSRTRTMTKRGLLTISSCAATEPRWSTSACLKDISGYGLGFVHEEPVPLGLAVVTFSIDGGPLSLEVDIRWSKQISKKWHNSGGFFLGTRQTQDTIDQILDQHLVADLGSVGRDAIA
ncbi:MAG TPA: hypothetical protein VHZ24_02750 [Pirellulales bacterium]|nr:hypothetical protein [Pirellulales bacterium]